MVTAPRPLGASQPPSSRPPWLPFLSLVYDRVHNVSDGTHAVLGTQTFTIWLLEVGDGHTRRPDPAPGRRPGAGDLRPVSYTHLRAHETPEQLVCRLLL